MWINRVCIAHWYISYHNLYVPVSNSLGHNYKENTMGAQINDGVFPWTLNLDNTAIYLCLFIFNWDVIVLIDYLT